MLNVTVKGVLVDMSDSLVCCFMKIDVSLPDVLSKVQVLCECATGVVTGDHLCNSLRVLMQ